MTGSFILSCLALAAPSDPPTPGSRIIDVHVQPERLVLDGPLDSRQLLVSGVREDGLAVDLTRETTLLDAPDGLHLSPRGVLTPTADGSGVLRLRAAGRTLAIAYDVRGTTDTLTPGFMQDVQPVLSRLGCNAGTCHGSAQGKNGFRLSLRGYDGHFDYRSLTDDLAGRRFDRAAPQQSLFLLKLTGDVPHEGGVRTDLESPEYQTLREWVAQGAAFDPDSPRVASIRILPDSPTIPEPGMEQQFAVVARYSDGSERDVTRLAFVETADLEVLSLDDGGLARSLRRGDAAVLARFEGAYASTRVFVMGDRSGFAWDSVPEFDPIDGLVYRRLEAIRTRPSDLCSDEVFLRRVRLDLTGTLPRVDEIRAFSLDRRDTQVKRTELIDRLIGSPEFIEHWTHKWCDLLQVNSKFLGDEGARALRGWIRKAVASNAPYDEFATALLTGVGSTVEQPSAAYFKIHREPDLAMENTTQLWLGIRFNCNKCHDHPFERWTYAQHWSTASWFSRIGRMDVDGSPKMPRSVAMEQGTQPPAYEEIISDLEAGVLTHPDTGIEYPPAFPFEHDGQVDANAPWRAQLAQWITAPENPYFATSYVNRLWSYFLGKGIIDPVDDIRASNPPSNPALLERLTADFIASGFDARSVMRRICRSRVYQHASDTNEWNEDDDTHFSHALPRRLSAETLFDAVHQAAGSRSALPGTRPGTRARDLVDSSIDGTDGFLGLFGRPPRESVCECERQSGLSLGHALNLVNGPTVARAIQDPQGAITELVAYEPDDERLLDELYLRFLARTPDDAERADLLTVIDPGRQATLAAAPPELAEEIATGRAAWEASIPLAAWTPLKPSLVESSGGATFTVLDDHSVLASGPNPSTESLTVVAFTDATNIRGLRLEALSHESLAGSGPGRSSNGNFVLNHVNLTALSRRNPADAGPVTFSMATADFSQQSWDAANTLADDAKGWAVVPNTGLDHQLVLEAAEDFGFEGGTMLVFKLEQRYGSEHTLGRFRLSLTTSDRPIRHPSVPDAVVEALAIPSDQRTEAQHDAALGFFLDTVPELRNRLRLHATQDLAWALANSPEFLFNR